MAPKIKILHLEDTPADAELVARELTKAKINPEILVVRNKAKFIKALKNFSYDIILSDHSLGSFDSHEALRLVKKAGVTVPFILITATMNDEFAAAIMKEGAYDYILKDRLGRLPSAIVNSIEKHGWEERQRAAHERLAFHIENTPLGFIEWDSELHIKALSKRAEEIFGWDLAESLENGRNGYSQVYEEDMPIAIKALKDLATGLVKRNTIQHRNITKDGRVIWCEWFNSVLKDNDGKVVTIMSLVQDITAQKIDEEKLNKANRLYSFISQINQSITHVKDEKVLFKNACTIALKFGKFKIAWIGMFGNADKTISNVDQIGISAADIEGFKEVALEADGPQQLVLKTGKHYICNDMMNDAGLESWKPLAVRQGVCSCMVLPIKKSGNVIGTFNLYAATVNFFDKEEIELLLEVTGDISFALDAFEKEKVHRYTEELLIQNEKLFRALIEKSTDMITLSTLNGKLLYGSPSITKALGFSLKEYESKSALDFIHPDDIDVFIDNRIDISKTPGKSFYYQQRLLHKNGTWLWCEGTDTNMLEDPGIGAIVSNFRDISEKKISEQRMEFDKNNLDALINNTDDLMWSVDTDFKLITSNQPFEALIKVISGKSVVGGMSLLEAAFSIEESIRYKKFYERAFAGESFREIIFNEGLVDSWSEVSYYPIRKGDEIIGTACQSRDITEKLKAERRVLVNEKRFRALVENGADAVAILSPGGNPSYVSPSIQGILGYTEEEAMATNLFSLVHPDDAEIAAAVWAGVLESPGLPIPDVTCRILHKNGAWRVLEGTFTNLLHDPAVNGIVNNFRDITDKKLAEEALLVTQFAIDNAGDAVFWMTADGRIVRVNKAACTMLGYTDDEITRLTIPDIDYHIDSEGWQAHFENLRRTGSLFFETIQRTKDGRLIPVEIRANYIKFGDAEFNCAFSRDITERKLAERRLIDSEIKLKEAQTVARIGNFELNMVDFSEEWSDQIYKILGIEKTGIVPAGSFSNYIHPDDLAIATAAYYAQQDSSMDYRLIRSDGIVRYVNSEWKFEFDDSGKAVRLYGVVQDITERKQGEIERKNLVNDLMLRNNELEQFGYIISHNLRAPVANIIGASNILNDPDLSMEDKEILNNGILVSVTRLDEVVKDLNRILDVKSDINDTKEIVAFSALVDDIKISINNLITKYDIEIKYNFGAINEFSTFKPYLYSIFYNLISNGIKFRRKQTHTVIEITSRLEKDKMELIFTDNGMGINLKKNDEDVFGLYKRFHTHIEGKGMGLFMVKTQVEALGGKIDVKSIENEGTEFKIEFAL